MVIKIDAMNAELTKIDLAKLIIETDKPSLLEKIKLVFKQEEKATTSVHESYAFFDILLRGANFNETNPLAC